VGYPMSTLTLKGATSGSSVLKAPDSGSNEVTFTMPASTGTLLTTDGDGSSLTGVGVDGISSSANATAITINSSEQVGIGTASPQTILSLDENTDAIIGLNRETSGGNGGDLQVRAGAGKGSGNAGGDLYLCSGTGTSSASVGKIQFGRSSGDDSTMPPDEIWTTIDSSGNVGIGVTPEAWDSSRTAIQLGTSSGGSAALYSTHDAVGMGENFYNNSGDKYINTSEATQYYQTDGSHVWKVAASGSADAAISWTTAMTIDNAGDIGVTGKIEIGSGFEFHSNNESRMTIRHDTGAVWIDGNCSAASFTDRTPYPETLQLAYDVINSHQKLPENEYKADDPSKQLDHSKLNEYVKEEDNNRNMSGVISCLVEVIKDLSAKVKTLEEA